MNTKNLFLYVSILFSLLAIIGGIYVLYTAGEANAGYAVIPMVFAVSASSVYHTIGNRDKNQKE